MLHFEEEIQLLVAELLTVWLSGNLRHWSGCLRPLLEVIWKLRCFSWVPCPIIWYIRVIFIELMLSVGSTTPCWCSKETVENIYNKARSQQDFKISFSHLSVFPCLSLLSAAMYYSTHLTYHYHNVFCDLFPVFVLIQCGVNWDWSIWVSRANSWFGR